MRPSASKVATAALRPRDRMTSPMMMAWSTSPPGDEKATVSPLRSLASSSLLRNQAAAAGPILPLTASTRRESAPDAAG